MTVLLPFLSLKNSFRIWNYGVMEDPSEQLEMEQFPILSKIMLKIRETNLY